MFTQSNEKRGQTRYFGVVGIEIVPISMIIHFTAVSPRIAESPESFFSPLRSEATALHKAYGPEGLVANRGADAAPPLAYSMVRTKTKSTAPLDTVRGGTSTSTLRVALVSRINIDLGDASPRLEPWLLGP